MNRIKLKKKEQAGKQISSFGFGYKLKVKIKSFYVKNNFGKIVYKKEIFICCCCWVFSISETIFYQRRFILAGFSVVITNIWYLVL